jgi:hypothetical protein
MPVDPVGSPSLNAIAPLWQDSLVVAWDISLVPTSERWTVTRVATLTACGP